MPRREGFGGEIERVTIPDSDMPGWIEVMRTSGLNQEEIDDFLGRMNRTYAKAKGVPDIEGELAELEEYMRKEHGKVWTDEQREYMRQAIAQRLEEEKNKNS